MVSSWVILYINKSPRIDRSSRMCVCLTPHMMKACVRRHFPSVAMKSLKPIKELLCDSSGVRALYIDASLSIKMYPPDVSCAQACLRFCLGSLPNGLKNLPGKGVVLNLHFAGSN